jgi:hypothetical protein
MRHNVHDIYILKLAYNYEKLEIYKNKFLMMIWNCDLNFQNETLNLQGIFTFKKIHIYLTMILRKLVIYWDNYKNFS